MTTRQRLRPFVAAALAAVASFAVLVQGGPVATSPAKAQRCGLTTLQGTIVWRDGKLECAPGEGLVVRREVHDGKGSRGGTPLAAFAAIGEVRLPDEESPLRAELADTCGVGPAKSAFRPHEALMPALLDAHVRAVNDIVAGPVSRRPFDFAVQLGSATATQQRNETRTFAELLAGGLVDPDSGDDGYDGNQARDPYASPLQGAGLLDLANEPFHAEGLRRRDGSSLPWFALAGDHDVKIGGTVPDNPVVKDAASTWAAGGLMLSNLAPDQRQRLCANPALLGDPAFLAELAARPGTVRPVPADAERALLERRAMLAELWKKSPAMATTTPCLGANGDPLARACYAWSVPAAAPGSPPVRFIAVDTVPSEGVDGGNIDQHQWDWLNAELKRHTASHYTADDGSARVSTGNKASIIVVVTHHSSQRLTNDTPTHQYPASYRAADLERLLLRFPNVVLHLAADGAPGATPHTRPSGGGYWEVVTDGIADFPHRSRAIELVDNHDGTLSIFGVAFDAAAPVNPAHMRWQSDATPETQSRFGRARRNVNEDMLASIARWVGANDPQAGARAVTARTPNLELIVRHPTGGLRPSVTLPRTPIDVPRVLPRPRFPFVSFPFPTVGQTPQNPFIPPPALPQRPFQAFQATERGLGAPFVGAAVQYREIGMTLVAAIVAALLVRARVRRNMIGL